MLPYSMLALEGMLANLRGPQPQCALWSKRARAIKMPHCAPRERERAKRDIFRGGELDALLAVACGDERWVVLEKLRAPCFELLPFAAEAGACAEDAS